MPTNLMTEIGTYPMPRRTRKTFLMHASLDTNVCVEIVRQGENFDALGLDLSICTISTLVRVEIDCGIQKVPTKLKSRLQARLFLLLGNVQDTLVAARTRAVNLAVVTANRREFEYVPHLKVILI